MPKFSHLHVHTQFSLLDGAANIKKLYSKAIADDMPALAITDHGNMFGVFQFVSEAYKNRREDGSLKIKPIVGSEFYLVNDRHKKQFTKEDKDVRYHQLMLAKNEEGYKNLCKLSSLGYIEGLYSKYPRIDKELVLQYHKGIIATTCCLGGEVPRTIREKGEKAGEDVFKWWLDLFGDDYYIELQRHQIPIQDEINRILLSWADKYQVKVIATNDSHYVEQNDYNAHDILLCINTGEKQSTPKANMDEDVFVKGTRFAFNNDQYFFKKQAEMSRLFADVPQAIDYTNEIIDKITPLQLKRDILLPNFPIPDTFKIHTKPQQFQKKKLETDVLNQWEYLRHLTYEGAKTRYPILTPSIEERITFELETIRNMGFPGYFLIVQDFIKAGRDIGVFVGPGRGSAAGSVVAYCIGITNIDPIKYDLLFERFLNPERISMPDIDTDFDDEGRQKVIDYVIEKYGKNQVAQIITYGTMAAKTSIQDVSRVLDFPIPDMNDLKRMLPDKIGFTLNDYLYKDIDKLKSSLTNEELAQIKTLRKIAEGSDIRSSILKEAALLEGSVRNTGVHAAGIIIAPDDLTNLLPVATAKDSDLLLTQFEGSVVEDAGVIKMDFLGLKTLTQIKHALRIIKKRHGISIDIDKVPLDDIKTFELYQRGDTTGTFQFESVGMQKYLQELKPDKFEDLIAMNALYRPGPMKYIPNFIKRKKGLESISYDLPEMEDILRETYGITVYQEQVMLLSQKLAGFTKGEADTLRKAMGKKKIEELNKMKAKFLEGAKAKGHSEKQLNKIWSDWEDFAQYAFNKSHSTCYAFVAFQTAYLKAHYPAEYMASVLNDAENIEKIAFFIEECKRIKLPVLGPDINESDVGFTVNTKGEIRFGLGAIKGVGDAAVSVIVNERKANSLYIDIFDFLRRNDLRSVNKRVIENLVMAGAFDSLSSITRSQYFAKEKGSDLTYIDIILKWAGQYRIHSTGTQSSLFGDTEDDGIVMPQPIECEEWPLKYILSMEKEVTGLYLSGHPLDEYRFDIDKYTNIKSLASLNSQDTVNELIEKPLRFGCMVVEKQDKLSKQGNGYGIYKVEDFVSNIDIRLFSEDYLKFKHFFVPDTALFIHAKIQARKDRNKKDGAEEKVLKILNIEMLQDIRVDRIKQYRFIVDIKKLTEPLLDQLMTIINKHPGKVPIHVRLLDKEAKHVIDLVTENKFIDPCNKFLDAINQLNGIEVDI